MIPVSKILEKFDVEGEFWDIVNTSGGFINDTYVVTFRKDEIDTQYVLQKINRHVFRRPVDVMNNLQVITDHCIKKDPKCRLPRPILTREGENIYCDRDGDYWRVITFIEGAKTYAKVLNLNHAEECGRIVGSFLRLVSDLEVEKVVDTIPGYHVTTEYLRQYDSAPKTMAPKEMRAFVEKRREFAGVLEAAVERGEIKKRVVHGDLRINNIMVDERTGKGVTMIDLDTASAGLVQVDLGDAVRSVCNAVGEDIEDVDEVGFLEDVFVAFVHGFMSRAKMFLTEADREYLYPAIRLLPFELGMRFLTDHLNGDVYFKVPHHGRNLQRARGQFRLCEIIEAREKRIREILKRA